MTSTVIDSVIRVAPPRLAAAPSTAYALGSMSDPTPTIPCTVLPTMCPMAAPTERDGTKRPVAAPTPYVQVMRNEQRRMKTQMGIMEKSQSASCAFTSSTLSPKCSSRRKASASGTKKSWPYVLYFPSGHHNRGKYLCSESVTTTSPARKSAALVTSMASASRGSQAHGDPYEVMKKRVPVTTAMRTTS